jgi:hypothetical protein
MKKERRDKIIKSFESNDFNPKRKKLTFGRHEKIEEVLILWMRSIWTPEMRVDGPLIREKARQLATKYNVDAFEASNGWLERFKKRFQIEYKTIHGESESVNTIVVNDWMSKIRSLIEGYKACDVYNGDEFGLFFRCNPRRSLLLKGQSCKGGKQSKLRITVFVCCNMDGSDKIKLSVIGKSAKPRSFGKKKIPVDYHNQDRAWMNTDIFGKMMSKLNDRFIGEKRKVIIFVDNFVCHMKSGNYSNIKLMFLPKNTTSLLQPCDAGIIKCIKQDYRQRLVMKLIMMLEKNGKSTLNDITLYDAILMLNASWKKLPPKTIINCFKKCGFHLGTNDIDLVDEDEQQVIDQDFNLIWNNSRNNLEIENTNFSFEDFVSFDDNLSVSIESTEESIADSIFGVSNIEEEEEDEEETEEEDNNNIIEKPIPTFPEVMNALSLIQSYTSDEDKSAQVSDLTDWFIKMQIKSQNYQPLITNYFTKM